MEAKNFRIGNLVEGYLEPQISEWVEYRVQRTDEQSCLDNIRPIRLNERHLIRLGFERYSDNFYRYGDSEGWMLSSEGLSKSLSEFFIRIKYVHELQNLFFALNNEELELEREPSA